MFLLLDLSKILLKRLTHQVTVLAFREVNGEIRKGNKKSYFAVFLVRLRSETPDAGNNKTTRSLFLGALVCWNEVRRSFS